MSKRSIDCAEILCLSKYNMYLEINLRYQCTIISIFLLQYKSFNGSTIFFVKNLLESLSPKQVLDHLFIFTFIVQNMLWIFVNGVAHTNTKYRKCFISCFYEKSLGSFYSLKRIQTIIDMEIIFHYFSVISFTCEVLDGILVLCLGNRTLAEWIQWMLNDKTYKNKYRKMKPINIIET